MNDECEHSFNLIPIFDGPGGCSFCGEYLECVKCKLKVYDYKDEFYSYKEKYEVLNEKAHNKYLKDVNYTLGGSCTY